MIGILMGLLTLHLRAPVTLTVDGSGNPVATFEPPLTAPEQATYDRIVRLAKSPIVGLTPQEYAAIESDIAGLVTFQGLPTPTQAQAVAAIRAQSRILRALLRS